MAPTDPHQGGNLTDMAVTGTTTPNDAGTYPTLPSVPNPSQEATSSSSSSSNNANGGLGSSSLATAADNATDMPKASKDIGATGQVVTGTGNQLPAQVESKNLHFGANNPLDKGHDRSDKHTVQKESDHERYAAE